MIAASLSVFVGYSLSSQSKVPLGLLLAVATSTISGNIINDYFDIKIDSINRPSRPIPSGVVSALHALVAYMIFIVVTVIVSMELPVVERLWISVWLVVLFFYSYTLKRRLLVGNLVVAGVSASGFLLGAFAGGDIRMGILPASYTFLFVLGREIVKDVDDLPGDSSMDARTLPIVIGSGKACKISASIFIALALLFPIPYFLNHYGVYYLLIMVLAMIPLLLVSAYYTFTERRLTEVSSLLKLGMFFGSVAFYFG